VRQEKRLVEYCKKEGMPYVSIQDLGSGINDKKKGLNILIKAIIEKKVSTLIITHQDRLLRFGSPLLYKLCAHFNTKVIVLDAPKESTFEQTLATDVIEIMTVFTAKLYGKRSHQNRQRCA